jgi:general secretion pathway protein I
MASLAQGQFTQMVDQLQKSVREVHLTVTWKEGKLTESIDLVTHVVSMGPGSDRNGGAVAAAGGAGGSGADSWVRPDGTPAHSPRPSPTGAGMVDDDGTTLVTAGQRGLGTGLPGGMPQLQNPGGLPFGIGAPNQFVPQGVGKVLVPPQGGFR